MNSLELAKDWGIRHTQVLNFIEGLTEFKDEFTKAKIVTENKKNIEAYKISKIGNVVLAVLLNTNSDKQQKVKEELIRQFKAIETIQGGENMNKINEAVKKLIKNRIISYEDITSTPKSYLPLLDLLEIDSTKLSLHEATLKQSRLADYILKETDFTYSSLRNWQGSQ